MIKFKIIYQYSFYSVALLIFLLGGMLQYITGISNTGMTLFLMVVMFANYALYIYIQKKIVLTAVIGITLIYILLILFSGLVNHSGIIRTLIYLIFPLLPLSIYLFFHINKKESFLKGSDLLKFTLYIAYLQLPILFIQRNFYELLIPFNNSSQHIASFDFLYGSFFIKSDHSLGFFLLTIIIAILLDIKGFRKNLKYPAFTVVYLSLTILLAESNISKGMLFLIWGVFFIVLFYQLCRKHALLRFVTLIILTFGLLTTIYSLRNSEVVESRLGGSIEHNFTPEKSYSFFKKGTAKRSHIIIAMLTKIDTKYIGDGPYSYFNILTGKFKNTIHFSQFIWTYFDIGLLGLITAILYLIFLILSLNQIRSVFLTFLIFCSAYFLFTTIYSEIAILFTLFLIIQRKKI